MDVRAGLNDYFARLTPEQRAAHGGLNPTPDTLQKRWVGARAAKKEAYAAAEPWAVRAEARAAEERARAEARAKARAKARAAEKQARVEARAAQEKARAEALALAARAAAAPLTEEETSAVLRAGGRAADLLRRHAEARATDADLQTKGKAGVAKVEVRKRNRRTADESRKRSKKRAETVAQEEAQLVERVAGLLVDLGRGGSNILDDDGDDGDEFGGHLDIEADEEAFEALEAMKAKEHKTRKDKDAIRKATNNRHRKRSDARKKASLDKVRRRVALLKIRVEALDEEFRALHRLN